MRISFKGDYALKIILDLALSHGKGVTQIKDISKRQDIPEKYLEQIITILKSARYVKTVRGPRGGVELAKDPSRITLGEIIRLMEGPTSPITCVSRSAYAKCTFEAKCVFKGIWEEVRDCVNGIVDATTFQDMVERHRKKTGEVILEYYI